MNTVGVTDYTKYAPPKNFGWKNVQHPSRIRKYLLKAHKIGGAHLQCVNNNYAKFE